MPRPRRLVSVAAFLAMASTSTASLAADNSAAWAALSAMSTSTAQVMPGRGVAVGNPFWAGAAIPLGIIISAAILAVVLADNPGRGRGRGFSPQ